MGVALSGGADSVALLGAMAALGWRCVALHCHFGLRGEESDRDSLHAEATARALGCDFSSVRFDVEARRRATGESLEMACRELRYEWFTRVAEESGLRFVAIAHNADDREETFFLNALRGSGLKGLGGIAPRRGIFVRPMLECSRREVLDYLGRRGLRYVTDSSNLVDDVKRNKLRLNVLPVLLRDFPSASKGLARTMENLRTDFGLLSALVEAVKPKYVEDRRVALKPIVDDFGEEAGGALLYHFLKDITGAEGSAATASRILGAIGESGRYFSFGAAKFLLDRGMLYLLDPLADGGSDDLLLFPTDLLRRDGRCSLSLGGVTLTAELLPTAAFAMPLGADEIWLDAAALDAPLTLRHPATGDRLAPFGMRGTTLLSKLMKDAKIPDNEKPRQWVLMAGDKTLWLCGIRSSRYYLVTESSESVVRLRLE
ncbi:MAG: tRNA lysidine(34) synthetase TilS [[Clostridium] fimetarium]|nr:tRNA lysidine(34) synthetase TilS [Alistipes timonensis]MCM1405019.1 tRNA lysidine(34) synthetase TilS [[Clostridium] fimetarium]